MEIRYFAQQSPVYVFRYASPQSFAQLWVELFYWDYSIGVVTVSLLLRF